MRINLFHKLSQNTLIFSLLKIIKENSYATIRRDHFWNFHAINEPFVTDKLYLTIHKLFSIKLHHGGHFQ